jgi:primary-amine oxidase
MELRNAILLHSPQTPGDPYTFDDYGVKQDFTCVPEQPSPFEYPQSQIIAPDGSVSFANSPEARRDAEMYFRVRIGA